MPFNESGVGVPRDEISTVASNLKELDNFEMTSDERKALVADTLDEMKKIFLEAGAKYHLDVNDVYNAFGQDSLIVRRENPSRLMEAIQSNKGIELEFDPEVNQGKKYANCVEWNRSYGSRGLENAAEEGYGGMGGIMMITAFDRGNLTITDIPKDAKVFDNIRRDLVRSAEGTIKPETLRFVAVGVPKKLFPEDQMTPEEEERWDEYIEDKGEKCAEAIRVFRGYVFPRQEAK